MASTLKANIQVTPQDILNASSTQQVDLGALATTGDRRYFRYMKVGATATVPGKVYQGPAEDTTNLNPSGGITMVAANTASVSVTLNSSLTLTANQLAGSLMSFAVTPGAGYTYKVKGNTAVSGATGCVVGLDDPLQTALTISSRAVFQLHPYNGIIITPGTTPTAMPVGVPTNIFTAAYYAWIQTGGPCACFQTGAGTNGTALGCLQSGTSGSLAPAIAGTTIVATAMGTNVTGEYDLVFLTLD